MRLLSLLVLSVSRSRLALAAVLLAVATFSACDKVPLLAPTESTITLNVSTTTVQVNGSATLMASVVEAAGTPAKRIDEYVGRVNSGTHGLSIAHMRSPAGWSEPPQTPAFDEYTVVLHGMLRIAHAAGVLDVAAGEAVIVRAGERVRYSTPAPGGAEYIAVCLPAFSMESVHRDTD